MLLNNRLREFVCLVQGFQAVNQHADRPGDLFHPNEVFVLRHELLMEVDQCSQSAPECFGCEVHVIFPPLLR